MEVLHPRCAGLDLHKDMLVAALRLIEAGEVRRLVETFSTTTPDLLRLSAWLDKHGCTQVAMEATGISWRPVWQVLAAEGRTLILANATHVKNVPGRKTDVADAVWLSDLLRTRKQLVREQASHIQRIQKTLEEANLKLASVLTDIMGLSGRAVLDALAAGETDPDRLCALVGPRVKASSGAIRAALTGRIGEPHRFLLGLHLRQYDALAAAVAEIDAQVERDLDPFREAVGLLATIPGISDLTAQVILSEIGPDMSRFATAGHLTPGPACAPGTTRARENAARPGSRRGLPGSRRRWCNPPGPGCARSRATSRPSSSACVTDADPRRPSALWPPPSSPPPITCSRTAPPTPIRAPITSRRSQRPPAPRPSSDRSSASASHAPSHQQSQFLFRVPRQTPDHRRRGRCLVRTAETAYWTSWRKRPAVVGGRLRRCPKSPS